MILKKQLKKKKGFTLVEVIVVLVILAILAAIAIPSLTGYIGRANDRGLLSEARTAGVALQTLISESVAPGADALPASDVAWVGAVNDLARTSYADNQITGVTSDADGVLTGFSFVNAAGDRQVIYTEADGYADP
ncbi:MAG: prepilin-type N-terminal cleavage/methylation domain-containing protein, partial [Clostridiales Family XIII bacterium]|nr:prepilin-type N-terminal cleavage/methylation domain-containing protein [Clostridiales Family XIII bacterium]